MLKRHHLPATRTLTTPEVTRTAERLRTSRGDLNEFLSVAFDLASVVAAMVTHPVLAVVLRVLIGGARVEFLKERSARVRRSVDLDS